MESLTQIDLPTFEHFLYVWVSLAVASAVAIYLTRQLPLSSRTPDQWLLKLGSIDKRTGWIVMETPILVAVGWFYAMGTNLLNGSAVIVGLFAFHYMYRALIFPHRVRVDGKRMPIVSVTATMIFYVVNGYLIGHYFGSLREYPADWLLDPRFLVGAALFLGGFAVNVRCDNALMRLRAPGETGYKIPRGGLFELVSCPNYTAEIVEWIGFAILSWSLPGAVYAAWVGLTLFATGLGTHRWYRDRFGDAYPNERRAVVPYLI